MKCAVAVLAATAAFFPSLAQAQNCGVSSTPPNIPATFAHDACVKANDLFVFLAPQVGVALSGGNVMLGEGGTLGGLGKRSIVLRVTALDGRVPANDVSFVSNGGQAASSDFGAVRAPVPVPSLDAAIGIFRGVPFGLTNIGGVDLLIGTTVVPDVSRDEFSVKSDGGGFAFNYGVRVGLLQESAAVPGIGVSVMRRRLPTTSLTYLTANDTIGMRDASITSTAIRLTFNKRLGLVAIGGGIGEDRLSSSGDGEAILNETVQGTAVRATIHTAMLDETRRGTAFLNLSLGLAAAQVVLEVGHSRAGSIRETLNTFGDRRANEAYRYGSLGLGFRF